MNEPTIITLPPLTGMRPRAVSVIKNAGIDNSAGNSHAGRTVRIDGHATRAATRSFVDELVREILVDFGFQSLELYAVDGELRELIMQAAVTHNVEDRVVAISAEDL